MYRSLTTMSHLFLYATLLNIVLCKCCKIGRFKLSKFIVLYFRELTCEGSAPINLQIHSIPASCLPRPSLLASLLYWIHIFVILKKFPLWSISALIKEKHQMKTNSWFTGFFLFLLPESYKTHCIILRQINEDLVSWT